MCGLQPLLFFATGSIGRGSLYRNMRAVNHLIELPAAERADDALYESSRFQLQDGRIPKKELPDTPLGIIYKPMLLQGLQLCQGN